jgi:hypothetical protein
MSRFYLRQAPPEIGAQSCDAFRARGVARKRARKIVGFEGLKGCENFDALVQLYTEL